jgi:hypothetical protein
MNFGLVLVGLENLKSHVVYFVVLGNLSLTVEIEDLALQMFLEK